MPPEPDREGYLDYKAKVEKGDSALQQRAELDCEKNPDTLSTALACYYNLHLTEKNIVKSLQKRDQDVIRESASRIKHIRHPAVRQEVSSGIEKLAKSWDAAKFGNHQEHIERHDSSIKKAIAKRQEQNPGESPGKSWVWAKLDVENRHLGRLEKYDKQLLEGIDNWIEGARRAEAKSLAAQVIARSRQRDHGNDNDRER
jgi:hypothetical protein